MVHSSTCRVVLLLLFSLFVVSVHSETDSALTILDHQETWSGEPPGDTTSPVSVVTFTFSYPEIFTSSQPFDEAFLGPGAITAIVIAVFLGVSVLLTLMVITLRKFMAS
ncbi:protein SNORC [Oryzias latipes]|uniref:protein SNORC n=1 Tax=Oryzias latipes TaxID=8090 RepID=UPI0005CC4C4A|nr:protein SNORC [Oryzias latipes]